MPTISPHRRRFFALACLAALTFAQPSPATAARHRSKPQAMRHHGKAHGSSRNHIKHHVNAGSRSAPDGVCGTRHAIAHFRDNTSSFARRNRISEATFCALNGIAPGSALAHKRRYVTARGGVGERLVGGASMGPSTPDYVVVNPARAWGQKSVVSLLRAAAHRVQQKFPGGQRIVFEDLSIERGGCLAPHREHRSGLEVDAGLYHKGLGALTHLRRATPGNFDARREWLFLNALLETGRVDRILLDPRIIGWLQREAVRAGTPPDKLARWFHTGRSRSRAIFTRAAGHDNHTHIRFLCPPGECALPVDLLPEQEETPVVQQTPFEPRSPTSLPPPMHPICAPLRDVP